MKLNNPQLLRDACLIGADWVGIGDNGAGPSLDIANPATGTPVGRVPSLGAAETRRAIDAAEAALPGWRAKTAAERGRLMRRWFDLMMANQEDLAQLMTAEQGKPLAEARGEIAYAASFIDWFAEEGKRVYGDTIPSPWPDRRLLVLKQPVGVCAAITPWNFPAAMITRKAAAALAAGCTMVVKPAEQTPLSALALGWLALEAGIPPGVLNLVTGDPVAIGGELTSNAKVMKLSFTGSTEVGRLLMRQCAPTLKKMSLELGGNAPFIVFDDADLDAAVAGAMLSKYRNAGQTCVCANRLLVQEGIYDAFAARLADAVKALKVGDGTQEGVNQGPLIDAPALAKVQELLADATAKGARIVCGGKAHGLGRTFFEPTVVCDVDPGMRIAREEIFGPVAPLYKFKTEADAIRMANDTEYGLAAYFFTGDIGRAWRVGEALDYGIVGINSGMISNEVAPFGGVKQSGLGREGSKYGIEEYLEVKYMAFGGI